MPLLSEKHINLLTKGDKGAYRLLYDNFFVALCLFAARYKLTKEESEDIVQDIFCKLYSEKELPKNITAFKNYLYTSVRNRCLNFLRNEERRKKNEAEYLHFQSDDFFLDKIIESEVFIELKLLLNELPPQCKNIFERTLNGDTSEKIAQDLGLSIETVKTQRKKAKKILREKYSSLYTMFGILF